MTAEAAPGSGQKTPPAPRAELWLVDISREWAALEALEARQGLLSDAEIARADKFKDSGERYRHWRAAHIALRLALTRFLGEAARRVPYVIEAAGKPVLPAPAPSFSLSHSAGLALIAVAERGSVGVDVEEARQRRVTPERRRMIEQAAIAIGGGAPLPCESDPELRFVQAWCRLEAAGKSDGRGVGAILSAAKGRAGGSLTRWAASGATTSEGAEGDWRVWDIDPWPEAPAGGQAYTCERRAPAAAALAVARGTPGFWPAPPAVRRDLLKERGVAVAAGLA